MPFFGWFGSSGSLFSPKKSNPRKAKLPLAMENYPGRAKDLGVEMNGEIRLKLGHVQCVFNEEDGSWINDISSSSDKKLKAEVLKLRALNAELTKEANMFRVKNEILLDMVSISQMKLNKLTTEVKDLRRILSKSPLRFAELQ